MSKQKKVKANQDIKMNALSKADEMDAEMLKSKDDGKAKEVLMEEAMLREELEQTIFRSGTKDISPVLDTGYADSLAQVDRILGVIRGLEKDIVGIEETVQSYIDYNIAIIDKLNKQIAYLGGSCHQWMLSQDQKTIKGANGTLKMVSRSKVLYGDSDSLIGWCKKNNVDAIRVKEELNKKALNDYVKSTGDAPDSELYKIEPETNFSITTNKQEKE